MKTLLFTMVSLFVAVSIAPAAACAEPNFDDGQWFRAALEIDADHEIPFFLWLPDDDSNDAIIRNGAEDITVDFDRTDTGGIVLDFPHYDSRIEAHIDKGKQWMFSGEWRKTRREEVSILPFRCSPRGTPGGDFQRFALVHLIRFPSALHESPINWKIEFAKSGPAMGRFIPTIGDIDGWLEIDGTIETTTGDYRFLSGVKSEERGGWLKLSVFDGAHAFLFDATIDETGRHMTGDFYSGNWWHETFTATRIEEGDDYQLPDPFSEVALKSGDGKLHIDALDDPRYIGKPVIVQIFGTWCPNSHEETGDLVDLFSRYQADGLEVLGLAYEATGDDERSRRQVQRFIERYTIPWQIVIAGINDKKLASKTLPDLSKVKSFPTLIWIGRDGKVRAIHSGFSGAATGDVHTKLLAEFDRLTQEITK